MYAKQQKNYENEIIALIQGFKKQVNEDSIILDMGSRDSKWASLKTLIEITTVQAQPAPL